MQEVCARSQNALPRQRLPVRRHCRSLDVRQSLRGEAVLAVSPPTPKSGYPQMIPALPKAIKLRPSRSVEAMSPLPRSLGREPVSVRQKQAGGRGGEQGPGLQGRANLG